MTAKVLRPMPFMGKMREKGEVISDDDLSMLTDSTKTALVHQGMIEIEGFGDAKGAGMTAADHEALRNLMGAFDKFRETMLKSVVEIHEKLDALKASRKKKD